MSRTSYDEMMQKTFNTKNAHSCYCGPSWENMNWVKPSLLKEGYCSNVDGGCSAGKSKYRSLGGDGCCVANVSCLSQPWSFSRSAYDEKYY